MAAKWTVMVYMAGNNSLSGAASVDLGELRKVGTTTAVQVAAFIKQRGADPVQRIVHKKAGDDVVTKLPPKTDSGSPQTVLDFARWAIAHAPAERYALVLWNHGGGWSPDDLDQLYQQVRGVRNRHESNRLSSRILTRTVFTPSVASILAIDSNPDRMICSDDTSGHSLDTIEVGRILAALTADIGRPLDLFGMDACLMSTLEVAYQVRKQARAVVGSEELEPGAGWKYDALLTTLNATPGMDGAALAASVVKGYVDSYKAHKDDWPVTQCAVDTARCEAFATTVDGLVKALRAKLETGWADLLKAHARAATFTLEMTDLRSLCNGLLATTKDAAVQAAARAVIDALTPGGYVLAEGHLGARVEDCGGVSIYLPSPASSQISPYYKDLEIAKAHRWDELLKDYFRAVKQ
jgi:hypothetical protein